MRAARLAMMLAMAGALLMPASLPALADGDGDDDDDDDDAGANGDGGGNGAGNGNGHGGGQGPGNGGGHEGGGGREDDDDERGEDEGDDEDDRRGDRDDDEDDEENDERDRDGKRKDRDRKRTASDALGANEPSRLAGPHPALEVSQDYRLAAGVMTFLFKVENHGDEPLDGVQLFGEVPAGPAWALADAKRCDLDGAAVACDVGRLAPGASRTLAVTGVATGDLPDFTNVVQVYAPGDAAAPSSP